MAFALPGNNGISRFALVMVLLFRLQPFFPVHMAVQDADDFYALGMLPIVDDIAMEVADGEEAHAVELHSPGLIQGAHARHGGQGFEGVFSGLIHAVGCL